VEAANLLIERAPKLGALGSVDPVALAHDLGEESLASRLETLRWSEPDRGLRARLRVAQSPSRVERSHRGEEVLRRHVAVHVDFENVGDHALSVCLEDPHAFMWHLVGAVAVGDDRHAIRDKPAPVGRRDIFTAASWTRIVPGATSTRRVSHGASPEERRRYDLDLVTHCWPTLGDDERRVPDRNHLRAMFRARLDPDTGAPNDAWTGTLDIPSRAIR